MTPMYHALLPEDKTAMAAYRQAAAAAKGMIGPEARPEFDQMMEQTPAANKVSYEAGVVGGVHGWWCLPDDVEPHTALLYLHGGAYVVGSALAYQHLAGQLADRARAATFVPDYRLAPEHPFPAAVDDAKAAYVALRDLGYTTVVLVGDSAGGGLTLVLLALAVAAANSGTGLRPRGAVVMSPWTDLALTGESMETHAEADPVLTKDALATCAHLYLGDHDPHDPLVSPLYGNLAGLPPVMIHVGADEILLDDSRRCADRLETESGDCQIHVWEGMSHVFPSSLGTLIASETALDEIGAFLRHLLHTGIK